MSNVTEDFYEIEKLNSNQADFDQYKQMQNDCSFDLNNLASSLCYLWPADPSYANCSLNKSVSSFANNFFKPVDLLDTSNSFMARKNSIESSIGSPILTPCPLTNNEQISSSPSSFNSSLYGNYLIDRQLMKSSTQAINQMQADQLTQIKAFGSDQCQTNRSNYSLHKPRLINSCQSIACNHPSCGTQSCSAQSSGQQAYGQPTFPPQSFAHQSCLQNNNSIGYNPINNANHSFLNSVMKTSANTFNMWNTEHISAYNNNFNNCDQSTSNNGFNFKTNQYPSVFMIKNQIQANLKSNVQNRMHLNVLNEEAISYRPSKIRRRFPSCTECVFCKNNGTSPEFFKGHILKDPEGIILCPILRRYNCPICQNGGGNYAHTIRYCPLNRPQNWKKAQMLKSLFANQNAGFASIKN